MVAIRRRPPSSSGTGPSGCTRIAARCATPRPRCRNGRSRRRCRPRSIARSSAPDRTTIRISASRSRCPAWSRRRASAATSARRKRTRRWRCSPAKSAVNMKAEDTLTAATRCGFVALIGAPNVGKSTLINALVGEKVSIVSRKVQTTRALIRGIVAEGNAQIILVDTPGIFAPKRRLDRAMVITAWTGAHEADLVCVLLDAKLGLDAEAEAIFEKLASVPHPKMLVINKIDLVPHEKLLALAKAANDRMKFEETFM